jgi:hypothetical protein
MNLLSFLLARLKEPSTYAGLGALLAAAGIHVPDATLNAAVSAAMALSGFAAVLMPELKRPAPPAAPPSASAGAGSQN